MEEGHFAPGSMLPKVQAAVRLCKFQEGRTALITLLEAREAVRNPPEPPFIYKSTFYHNCTSAEGARGESIPRFLPLALLFIH